MIPPTSGIHARAAATLEGRPLDVDLVIGSGGGSGAGDTGGGKFGSAGSGMGLVTQTGDGFVNSECFREPAPNDFAHTPAIFAAGSIAREAVDFPFASRQNCYSRIGSG